MSKAFTKASRIFSYTLIVGAVVLSGAAKASGCMNPFTLTLKDEVTMIFCEIPAAQVLIGGPKRGYYDESPAKARDFRKFQIGQFEVTQLQYKTLRGSEPWKDKDGNVPDPHVQEDDNNPAVYIDYYSARYFAELLTALDPTATYMLPTEAEYEYAARSGKTNGFYWGVESPVDFAYFKDSTTITGQFAHRVDSCPNKKLDQANPGYCANSFGLFHMLGNVAEWTRDDYVSNYHDAPTNGHQAARNYMSDSQYPAKVIRGGAWNSTPWGLRLSGFREYNSPQFWASNALGFRLVRHPKLP